MSSYSDTNEILTPSRRRQKKRRFIIFWSTVSIAILCIGGIFYFLFYSNVIKVRQFSVEGNRVAGGADVQALLVEKLNTRGWFARKLGPQNILYWIGVGTLRDSGIPAAQALVVHASLIHRTVTIEIKERQFAGIWCADTCVGFDPDGVAYFLAPDVEGSLLLKIQDENNTPLVVGSPVLSDGTALSNIFQSIALVKQSGVAIAEVRIKDIALREWELVSTKGTQFKFSLDFVPEKLKGVIQNISERTKLENLTYVDMRVQNRVYFK